MEPSQIVYALSFWAVAGIAVVSAALVAWHRNPVVSALNLVMCFFAVAVAYVLLGAHFLAALQVLLYAGAILVLFVMIVMLVNQDEPSLRRARPTVIKALAGFAAMGIVVILAIAGGARSIEVENAGTPVEEEAALLRLNSIIAAEMTATKDLNTHVLQKPHYEKSLGERSQAKFSPAAAAKEKELTDAKIQEIAVDALDRLANPDVRAFFKLPPNIMVSRERFNLLVERLRVQVNQNNGNLAAIEEPVDFTEFRRADLMEFVESAIETKVRMREEFGSTRMVGLLTFRRYVLPFEAVSILLLAAIIGVLVLARRPEKGDA